MPLDDAGREGELAVDVLGEAGDRRWREERTSGTGERAVDDVFTRAVLLAGDGWPELAAKKVCNKPHQASLPD